ncbi:Ig-like domain-containing protein [Edaphobacter sp. 12200R-103]|uniref:Ig-like domain-containing protein n=1 Tax=Edaphobacter sp. 12200R-103 TaxID=2703788 RepID=UPI00138D0311|nr:Ig-like domain-containing protein [Edaphobacter sp. 12200R-103]QHS52165.1 Ig-like domain repeat protein [Edaphobacter sp. 12200R-103]
MSIYKLLWTMAALLSLPYGMGAQMKVPTAVALNVTTPLTLSYGETIDGVAQITAVDGSAVTGTVTFYDGTKSFCTLTLTNGASCPAEAAQGFEVGTHLFTAVYSGDATHAGARSNPVTVTVQPDTTTTAVASSAAMVATGGSVVYTATVAGAHGPASGLVTFLDGTTTMGSTGLTDNGVAALSVLMLVAGNHEITARYEGNGNLQGSTSVAVPVMVQGALATTTTTVSASAASATQGQNVTFTAKVAAAGGKVAPSGAVIFEDGGAAVGSAAVTAGTAVWSTSTLSTGSHSIVARYGGDATAAGSVSAPLNLVVNAQQGSQDGLTLGSTTITVAAGDTVSVPVMMKTGSATTKAVSLSCRGLPEEASCSYVPGSAVATGQGTATLRISTSAPRDCGSSTPYGGPTASSALPLAGVLLMMASRRRRTVKQLLVVLCAVGTIGVMSGCGTGNCTDLGTRPGTYTITVMGSVGGAQVSQMVKLVVTP